MRRRPAGLESGAGWWPRRRSSARARRIAHVECWGQAAAGGARGRRRAARSLATEADSVTTGRMTSRPPHRTQTRRSVSKVRFNKVRQSMRAVAAYSSPSRMRFQWAMQRTFGATCSALPVVVSDEVTTASTASRRKTARPSPAGGGGAPRGLAGVFFPATSSRALTLHAFAGDGGWGTTRARHRWRGASTP